MQYMNIIFVCNEELKGSMQGYSLCLLGNQLKFQLQPFGCNVRAHLLRNNYSRNFSSIRSGPVSLRTSLLMKNVSISVFYFANVKKTLVCSQTILNV